MVFSEIVAVAVRSAATLPQRRKRTSRARHSKTDIELASPQFDSGLLGWRPIGGRCTESRIDGCKQSLEATKGLTSKEREA